MHSIFKQEENIFSKVLEQEQIEKLTKQSVDLSEIYNVLYDLFEKEGSLLTEDTNSYSNSPDKIQFSFSHPDIDLKTNSNLIVIYDLVERKRFSNQTTSGNIRQEKPREVANYYDLKTGGVKSAYSYTYTNKIELTVVASTSEKLYQSLEYLETTFTKNTGYFHKYFTRLLYEGMYSNGLASNNNPYNRPIHSKTICLRIDTESPFDVVYEQIQQIDIENKKEYK